MGDGPDDLAPLPPRPGLTAFARSWAKAVTGTSYLPMTQSELEAFLLGLTTRMAQAVRCEPFESRIGYQIAAELVNAHIASAEGLGRSIEVIDLRLIRDLGLSGEDVQNRMARLLGAIATGYARALRDRTLDEQEAIRRAAMLAREQAERALRVSESRFRHQATHDPLTDLPNRTLFTEYLGTAFDEGEATRRRLGVCFIDIDGFKVINDTLGHQVGDLLLVSVANRLRQAAGEHLVARLGGDEFVILIEDTTDSEDTTDAEDARKIAEAALAAIAEPTIIDGHELTVSGCVGIVERPIAGTTPSEIMQAADVTLHWAKSSGRGRWALFDAERYEQELARYALAAQMPSALDAGAFYLDYQPLVSLADHVVRGVEALVRWRHPQRGVLGPDSFIELAEETGLIVRLGARVLAEACRQASNWHQESAAAPFVSVNLAVRQIQDPGLIDTVTVLLDQTGLPPERLQLEITESALMSTASEPVRVLRTLSGLGIRIAIDDFGTGYSNLSYLRTLPVDSLKIDSSFIAGLRTPGRDPRTLTDERILATLVSLAHTLGLTVTVEGVETEAQAKWLRDLGCDAAQGWHFGRPCPPAQITACLP